MDKQPTQQPSKVRYGYTGKAPAVVPQYSKTDNKDTYVAETKHVNPFTGAEMEIL